jgi:dephospho-CoA kinase
LKDIVAEFGSDILIDSSNVDSSEIDRKKLGAIVFSDSKAMSVRR